MELLLLEVLLVLVIAIVIVWWTMFSGRKGGKKVDLSKDLPKNHDNVGGP
jgi:hypothetical protein